MGKESSRIEGVVIYDDLRKRWLPLIPSFTLGIVVLSLYFCFSPCFPDMYIILYWDLKELFLSHI